MPKPQRKKYTVTGNVTITVVTDVMALSELDATEKARERGMMSLCHQCATGEPTEEWVTTGELDGEPMDLTAEEIES